MQSTREQIIRKTGVLTVLILAVKPIAILTQAVMANFWGRSDQMDDYALAFSITFLVGTVIQAIQYYVIPALTRYLAAGRQEEAARLTRFSLVFFTALLIVLGLAIFLAAGPFVNLGLRLLSTGGEVDTARVVLILQCLSPTLITLGLIGLITSILNCYGVYYWPVLGTVAINLGALFGMFLLRPLFAPDHDILSLVTGNIAGGALAIIIMIPALIKQNIFRGATLSPPPGELREAHSVLWPILIISCLSQFASFAERFMCYDLSRGSVAALSYAFAFLTIPLQLGEMSFFRVFFPSVSLEAAAEGHERAAETILFSIKTLLFAFLPLSLFLMVFCREPIVIIYQQGSFTAEDTHFTSNVLLSYSAGLWAHALNNLLFAVVFFSIRRPWWRVGIVFLGVLTQILLNFLLRGPLGASGIALSQTLARSLDVVTAVILLSVVLPGFSYRLLGNFIWRIVVACGGMALVCLLTRMGMELVVDPINKTGALVILVVGAAAAALSFLALAVGLKIKTLAELKQTAALIFHRRGE